MRIDLRYATMISQVLEVWGVILSKSCIKIRDGQTTSTCPAKAQVLDDAPVKAEVEEDEEADPGEDGEESEEMERGEFEPDSDDDDLVRSRKSHKDSVSTDVVMGQEGGIAPIAPVIVANDNLNAIKPDGEASVDRTESDNNAAQDVVRNTVILRQETTRSLAYRLLDMDVGYSSGRGWGR